MRVLVVHNRYSSRSPSGENLAVADETAWLQDAGVEVVPHEANNDDVFAGNPIQRLRQATAAAWSLPEQRRLARAIDAEKPDLVHVHNVFPLMSASVPAGAIRAGLPVVWTVHNFRIACVGGSYFRDGRPCHDCTRGWRLPGVRHGCYGDSRVASALVTVSSSFLARQARRRMTVLAISESVRDFVISTGVDPGRVKVKYNGVARPTTDAGAVSPAQSSVILFAGRLVEHKGIDLLIDAWTSASLPDHAELHVVGDGPMAATVRQAERHDRRIRWLGPIPAEDVHAHMLRARAVVVPSTWDETFGRVAAEAFACGRPVITTGLGGLSEVVDPQSGWITGTDTTALATALAEAATSGGEVEARGRAARLRYGKLFSPEATTQTLLDVYRALLG